LSRDHKPDLKDESQRIKKKNGRIEPYRDENNEFMGPARVWLRDEEIPGLAMSRSFGDEVAASVGIIAQPEISEWKLTPEDKFIILASDGVWEFIDSEEVIISNLVRKYNKRLLLKQRYSWSL
jgi:serine/threonine protein phosphatase PrpC